MAEGGSKLSEEEIYECLKSLNVPVRMNDLKVPSREFIVRVFECFLKDLQIDVTSPELRTWEATKHLEEGDIYEEGMFLTLLAMAVDHITNPWGLNISIKDIVEPKPKRTKKILNYILVFWNYYIRKCAHFHAVEDTFEGEKQKIEDLILDNQSLDEKYSDLSNALKNMQPNKEELSDIVAVKEEKVTKLKMEGDSIGIDYQDLKTKEANLYKEISAIDISVVTAKQSIEELGELILSSPERISTEVQKLRDRMKTEDLNIKEFDNRCKDAEKKLQLLEEYRGEEEKDVKALNDLKEEISHLKETVREIVSAYQKIGDENDKVKRLQMDVNRKEDSKLQQEQKSAKIVLNSKKQIETLKEVLKLNLNEEVSERKNIEFIKVAVNDIQTNIDSTTDSVHEVITKCKEADAKGKARKAQYMSKMTETRNSFASDCDEVLEVIKKTFPYELENIHLSETDE